MDAQGFHYLLTITVVFNSPGQNQQVDGVLEFVIGVYKVMIRVRWIIIFNKLQEKKRHQMQQRTYMKPIISRTGQFLDLCLDNI